MWVRGGTCRVLASSCKPLRRVTLPGKGKRLWLAVSQIPDPFLEARNKEGALRCLFQGESVPMLLRHADVREAAKDWKTFSSDAPFRVPIPSEEEVRTVRQLPLECDPPEHTEYRAIVNPFFERPRQPEMIAKVEALIAEKVDEALGRDSLEATREFALPLQSRALTYLLNVPETEAKAWIGWGIHVFKAESGDFKRNNPLEEYLNAQLDRAEQNPGADFFSALTRATFRGRRLTREEMVGFGNLAFAGGRDTIIHSITSIIAHLARHPEAIDYLREDSKRHIHASEEFFRVFMPLTHIGRVCPAGANAQGAPVKPGGRVSLGWAAANLDERVFRDPCEVRLDRRPNPHLSFGFGTHLCLGAPHARLVVRTLLGTIANRVARIEILEAREHVERESSYERANGFDLLKVKFIARAS